MTLRECRREPERDRTFGNFLHHPTGDILDSVRTMTYLSSRAPRVRFKELTPAVVRLRNGWRVSGELLMISTTGGLLCLAKPVDRGSEVKVMFLTESGPVLGAAEMLSPVSERVQPFKFIALYNDDRRRLQAAIQSSQEQTRQDRQQIEMFRAW